MSDETIQETEPDVNEAKAKAYNKIISLIPDDKGLTPLEAVKIVSIISYIKQEAEGNDDAAGIVDTLMQMFYSEKSSDTDAKGK